MNRILIRLSAALLLATTAVGVQAQTCSDPDTLRLAVIPQTKEQSAARHYDALVETLGDELGRNVMLVSVGSYGAVIEGLFDGSIDLAELGSGSYALARDRGADVTAFASMQNRAGTTGPAVYHSVLVTRRDSAFRTLEDLKEATVSLVDPVSTSGGIVPRVALQRLTGGPMEAWFSRVSFAGSHDAAINAVLNGRVAAAFVADSWVSRTEHQGRPAADILHIVWRSEPIPSDPFVYQNVLCEPVKQAIHRVFFERQGELQPLFEWRDRLRFVPVSDSDYQLLMLK